LLLLFTRTVLPPSLVRSDRKMRPDMLA
jgi:hypothetical protein